MNANQIGKWCFAERKKKMGEEGRKKRRREKRSGKKRERNGMERKGKEKRKEEYLVITP